MCTLVVVYICGEEMSKESEKRKKKQNEVNLYCAHLVKVYMVARCWRD